MARLSQRHQRTSLPFEYASEGLRLDIEKCTLDDRETVEVGLGPGETTVDLTPSRINGGADGEVPWNVATLSIRLEVPREVVEKVFPEDEREEPPAMLYVAIRCRETIYRDREVVEESKITDSAYTQDIELNWSELRGTVELRPYLVRANSCDECKKYANEKNVRVADGAAHTVLLEDDERDEYTFIDGEEVHFSESTHLPDGQKLYYLDFKAEARPKLWINADNPRIADTLQTDGSIGARPRMRDVILDQISYGVWTQLIVRAACAIDSQGGVPHEWQRSVIEAFGRHLYEVDDDTEVTSRLKREMEATEEIPFLMERIDRELQDFIDPKSQMIKLMEEGLRI